MSATLLYRIAAGPLILFAVTHTVGILAEKSATPQAAVVRQAMRDVHFSAMGRTNTYYSYFIGFGLSLSAYLLFAAFVAWHVGGLAKSKAAIVSKLGWALFAVRVAIFVLCYVYFFAAPMIVSGLIALCVGLAALKTKPVAA